MRIRTRIKKEYLAIPLMIKGFPRNVVNAWFDSIQNDYLMHGIEYDRDLLRYWYKRGYLSSSIERWGHACLLESDWISDFNYICLFPINNSFGKWLADMLTTQRIVNPSEGHFREIYFSIIQRENVQLILRVGNEDRRYTFMDVLDLVREKGRAELLPTNWNSESERYILNCGTNNEREKELLYCNGELISPEALEKIIDELNTSYVLADVVPDRYHFPGMKFEHELEIWIANDIGDRPKIISAEMHIFTKYPVQKKEKTCTVPVDLFNGTFIYREEIFKIPQWNELKKNLCRDAKKILQISFFSVSVIFAQDGSFTYLNFSESPRLPQSRFGKELNFYLKTKFGTHFRQKAGEKRLGFLWNKLRFIGIKTFSRKGMRPYMYELWRRSVWEDLLHTKGVSLPQKIWAHKHGFFSWRLYQYGLTNKTYRMFLSDYDYYWLNRINNEFQIWVNDKTTFRYIMEPFKEYIPKYYFSIFKRDEEMIICKMPDCPIDVPGDFDGLIKLLQREGKLAFKASSGTHGDGFYCLSYEKDMFFANGIPCGKEGIYRLITKVESIYVVTEYIEMHRNLKKIYDKSVNTVRIMVVNDHGYDPRILQSYMRIGSNKTGYTDNVGRGGICAFVNKESGELYQPEQIVNHRFIPCPNHPDTGALIAGVLPNWEFTKAKILEICRYLCELEYLGFDVAITDEGFQVLEINIHQDLHKVASFNSEIKDYFNRKIEDKKSKVAAGLGE